MATIAEQGRTIEQQFAELRTPITRRGSGLKPEEQDHHVAQQFNYGFSLEKQGHIVFTREEAVIDNQFAGHRPTIEVPAVSTDVVADFKPSLDQVKDGINPLDAARNIGHYTTGTKH